jgi:phosphatidate cytidylyltransferase
LLGAACIIAPLLGILWLDFAWLSDAAGLLIYGVAVLMWLMAAAELHAMIGGTTPIAPAAIYFPAVVCVVLSAGVRVMWEAVSDYPVNCPFGQFGWPLYGLAAALGLLLLDEMRRYRQGQSGAVLRLATAMFAITYLGVPLALIVALRLYGGNQWGMTALLSLLIIVKVSDSGAYAAGRLAGRHKMSPQLSPNKTIEGAIGGLLAAVAAAWACRLWLVPALVGNAAVGSAGNAGDAGNVLAWALYGLLLAIAGMAGDLAESLIKRDLGCKDSSRWLPGLGGVLDLIDSLLFAGPVAYACWAAGLIGPAGAGP